MHIVIPVVSLLGIIVTMGLLYQYAYVVNQTIEREARVPTSLRTKSSVSKEEEGETDDAAPVANGENGENETPQDRVQHLSRLYRREITIQATSYVLAFCVTDIPLVIGVSLAENLFFSSVLDAIAIFTYPLGGFLNILVYTRPKVDSLRRRSHPGCSRLRGFWLVLRAGGEIPEVDLSVSCCQDCCHAPALDDSEYTTASSNNSRNLRGNEKTFI